MNKWCYYFSRVVSEGTKDERSSHVEENIQLDIQEAYLASGGSETSEGGTSDGGAKGRGAR